MTVTERTPHRGLPAIAPYPLPTIEHLAPAQVGWELSADRCALLVHDMQNHFVDAFARDDGMAAPTDAVTNHVNRLRSRCRALGIPVVFSAQPPAQSPKDRGLLGDFWGPGLQDERAAAIVDALAPGPDDVVLTKWRYSAFVRTSLHSLLAEQGRDQLVITGIYTHIGCLTTAVQAFMLDLQPFVVADATADFSLADHCNALDYVSRRCGVVLDTDGALAALGPASFTRDQVRAALAELAGEEPTALADDVDIADSGLDSLRIMALVETWRAAGLRVDPEDLLERATIGEWCDLLATE